MENRNFRSYTVQDLVNKMKKLRQKYKQEKDKSSRSGTGKRKKWKFFEIIDRTLCDKPQVKPPLVIDSSASSTADLHDTVNDENSEKGDNDNHDNDVSYDGSQPSLPFEEQALLCTEGTTVQGNEEKHKAKDQEDCKITSRAPNKKRKRSNMEKSLDVFCERFTQISKEETERHLKAEEDRHKREMDFQLKQAQLENERRRSEREHEMNVLRLILSHGHVSTGRIHYPPNDNWGQNYPGMSANSMFQPCIPTHSSMDNISVSDSDGSTFATL
ncbi:uncharacterized protein LOC141879314 isoform X1 [Acropora palmata]